MPTDVIKKIGATNTPTVMDYSSLQAWADACPADLVAADQRWIGECYDQGTLTGAVVFAAKTTDATRYMYLRCAAGAGFAGKAGVRTTPLIYNAARGVAVENSGSSGHVVRTDCNYSRIEGLQVKATGYALAVRVNNALNCTVSGCIVTTAGVGTSGVIVDSGTNAATTVWANCLVHVPLTGGSAAAVHGKVDNCTLVATGGPGTITGLATEYNQAVIRNTAVFGFSSFTTGTPAAGSDYNATDNASAVTGTHNLTSLAFASQFQGTTNDFRALTTGALKAGTPDAVNAPNDISGLARDATTPFIGAWEGTPPASSFSVSPAAIPAGHSGNIALTLAGSGESWVDGSTVFTLSGVTGVVKVSQSVTGTNAATVVVTTGAGTGTLTVAETVTGAGDSATTAVAAATLSASPATAALSGTTSITLTGTNTLWATDHPAFTFGTVPGTTIGTISWASNTSATATMTTGSTSGGGTLTDPSTGATTGFTVGGTIAVTAPVAWQTFQRDGTNRAGIPISGTYTGTPGALTVEASFNGGAYATIATGSGGTYSGTLAAQAAGQGTLTVRFAGATGISAGVPTVGIGDVLLIAGQSNAVGLLDAQQTYANAAGLKAACYNGIAWVEGRDYFVDSTHYGVSLSAFGSPWPLLATHHMNDQGVPCALIQTAIGGRSLAAGSPDPWFWTKYDPTSGTPGGQGVGGGPGYAHITTILAASGVNSVKAAVWYQGENDVDGSVDRASYTAALVTFANNLHRDVAGNPPLFPIQLGYDGGGLGTPIAVRLAAADAVRLDPNLSGMAALYDFTNSLHINTQQQGQNVADRSWAALKSELFGGTAGNGHGPRLVGCQHDPGRTTITVTFDKALKPGLTMAAGLWSVTGNGLAATVASVAYGTDPASAVLTLAAAAATPILVSFAAGTATAGLVPPRGPDFTLPGTAGTINLPAEPFQGAPTAPAAAGGGGGGTAQVFAPIGCGFIRGN